MHDSGARLSFFLSTSLRHKPLDKNWDYDPAMPEADFKGRGALAPPGM